MKFKKVGLKLVALFIMTVVFSSADAGIWESGADYSGDNNPTGQWSYGGNPLQKEAFFTKSNLMKGGKHESFNFTSTGNERLDL